MNSSALTEQILTLWKLTDAFQQSIATRSEKLSYTFYDGPPFTSGDPHYGHLLQSIVKDMVPRWMTMRGYRVNRKRGWDCHGIPAENFVNKQLGITSKKQVEEEFGLQNYIEACRSMVNQVNDNRKWTIDRIWRRVDMDNAYFTMDNDFMESVICLFSDLYHRNLIYKWFKVLGYSRALGTALSNSEIAEGYEMRQDPAVTVKLPVQNNEEILQRYTDIATHAADSAIEVVVGVIKDEQGRYLMIYKNRLNKRYFPGGKVFKGESPADALKREMQEELWVEVVSEQFLGHAKTIHHARVYRLHYFQVTISGTPTVQEPVNHGMVEWIQKVPSENEFGYVLKFADLIITDIQQLRFEFADIHMLESWLIGHEKSGEASISILPWTTTPWTLPANMFAAVHRDIEYVEIFDKQTEEYYILAEKCLPKYYKSSEEYLRVHIFTWAELVGLSYEPLFAYYPDNVFKKQIHRILHAEFVTTDSGTGIVHEAPAFGVDDYELVAAVLGKDNAQAWLFDPVNEYGEFTTDAPDFAGQNVIEANKDIIQNLKSRNLLVKQETINHSYPHCPRTKTPLIYKAIESWFVKEEQLKTQTVPAAEQIHFVPETVKQRFINGLASAPDRNISRTRFRWAPLPVWESEDGSDTLVLWSKEEIYQYSKTGSKNLTKFLLMRHGEWDHNKDNIFDSCHFRLNETGKKQAICWKDSLVNMLDQTPIIVISPVHRCRESIFPYLQTIYTEDEMKIILEKYTDINQKFVTMYDDESLVTFVHDATNELFVHLYDKVYVDYRICEVIAPSINGKKDVTTQEYNPTWSSTPVAERAESLFDIFQRTEQHIQDMVAKFPGEEVMVIWHVRMFSVYMKHFHDFDYETQHKKYRLKNCEVKVLYYDAHTKKEIDLHRPYIDNVWFMKDWKKYTRIPEVLDCWFESGAMPYGQDHFMKDEEGEKLKVENGNKEINNSQPSTLNVSTIFTNCANFIAEGLDQTRGWFRALHVLGHAYHGQNVFQNVVVTGMILAEDGKKMSKSLKNYPDPTHLINQYGADALRLYLLSSPVVRSEPLRFAEKWVEQMLKDVVIPLQNVFNFFKMYAEVDQRKDQWTQVWFLRHALKSQIAVQEQLTTWWITKEWETLQDIDLSLSEEWFEQLLSAEFIEQVVRINPDVIICSDFLRAKQTTQWVLDVLQNYLWKEISVEYTSDRGYAIKPHHTYDQYNTYEESEFEQNARSAADIYQELLEKHTGKRILIVSHKRRFRYLRQRLMNIQEDINTPQALQHYLLHFEQPVPLPLTQVTNELDQWILAELHRTITTVDGALRKYTIEEATIHLMSFVDNLTNRYLRRSRRRFRTEEMTDDKQQAYTTLFTVIRTYLQLCAPFIPFVTEQLWQELQAFTSTSDAHPSVHLQARPLSSPLYINHQLIDEIETVRKIIKGALYLRAKHQIKVKQPLPSLSFKI
jgi:isoleucyl-tRNA synthetase